MRDHRFLRHTAVVTLALFLAGFASPLAAAQLDLHLERTPAVENLRLDLDLPAAPDEASAIVRDGVPSPEAGLLDLRSAAHWRALGFAELASAAQQDPDVGQGGNRTWRWLKRHWWVPVLVAGAIALAVQDDTPDNDD